MHQSSIFLLAVSFQILAPAFSLVCHHCASPKLSGKWDMTGMPSRDEIEFKNCDGVDDSTPSVDCSSTCIQIIFQDPDTINKTSGSVEHLFLRACANKLVKTSSFPSLGGKDIKCQTGTVTEFSSAGRKVPVKVWFRYCNFDKCNSQAQSAPCEDSSPRNQNCYECEKDSSNCEEGRCSGAWCFKAEEHINDERRVVKKCSPYNPYGTAASCQDVNLLIPVGPSADHSLRSSSPIDFRSTQCYCDDYWCNHASLTQVSLLLSVLSLLFVFGHLFA